MKLTDSAVKAAKPKISSNGKVTINRLTDGKGMYLFVSESGQKYFRYDYKVGNKRKTLSLGVYPETSLKEAREKHAEARKLVEKDIDPVNVKRAKKQQLIDDTVNSFKAVAIEWFEKYKNSWSAGHAQRKWQFLEKDIFPIFGDTPIKNIKPRELLGALEKIQKRGAIETAHRAKSICGEVFRYGIVTDKCERDITQDLKGALIPSIAKNMAAITNPIEVGKLLRVIDDYNGDEITRCALKLSAYVMLRPGELRHAEWAEIDFEKKQWKIPAEKMKKRRPHIIPLSNQAIAIFKEIQQLTGKWRYVFPSLRSKDRPLSNNTVNGAIRRMGYTKEEMTAHGFRGMASTLLHENGFDSAHIEAQLAHAEHNKVKAAYNHAEYLDQRAEMLQWWADYLDSLRQD